MIRAERRLDGEIRRHGRRRTVDPVSPRRVDAGTRTPIPSPRRRAGRAPRRARSLRGHSASPPPGPTATIWPPPAVLPAVVVVVFIVTQTHLHLSTAPNYRKQSRDPDQMLMMTVTTMVIGRHWTDTSSPRGRWRPAWSWR